MITTIDGHKAKRGERVWEIGVTLKGVYMPTMGIVHSRSNPVTNEEKCWLSYSKCLAECEKKNKSKKH